MLATQAAEEGWTASLRQAAVKLVVAVLCFLSVPALVASGRERLSQISVNSPPLPAPSPLPSPRAAVDVVVSRFSEDVATISAIINLVLAQNPGARAFVYDKADDANAFSADAFGSGVTVRRIDNVGMIDHAYLSHIVDMVEGDDLADFTFFVTGTVLKARDSVDKSAAFERLLQTAGPMASLVQGGAIFGKTAAPREPFYWCDESFQIDAYTPGANWSPEAQGRFRPLVKASARPLVSWLNEFLEPRGILDRIGGLQMCSYWGIFGATRRAIEQWPLGMWQRLRDEVGVALDGEAAHYMERTWYLLLQSDDVVGRVS